MKKFIVAMAVALFFCSNQYAKAAYECPEIDGNLRLELYKHFPEYSIAFSDTFSIQELQQIAVVTEGGCPHIFALAPSLYVVLLKAKNEKSYTIVQATPSTLNGKVGWSVAEIDTYTDDIPTLKKARGGFYSDLATGDEIVVTRNSNACMVTLLNTGKQFVYKSINSDEYQKCQIK